MNNGKRAGHLIQKFQEDILEKIRLQEGLKLDFSDLGCGEKAPEGIFEFGFKALKQVTQFLKSNLSNAEIKVLHISVFFYLLEDEQFKCESRVAKSDFRALVNQIDLRAMPALFIQKEQPGVSHIKGFAMFRTSLDDLPEKYVHDEFIYCYKEMYFSDDLSDPWSRDLMILYDAHSNKT